MAAATVGQTEAAVVEVVPTAELAVAANKIEVRVVVRVVNPGVHATPLTPQRAAVTAIMSTDRTLGTVWNPTPVPGRIAAPPRTEGPTNLATSRKNLTTFQHQVK